jgi:hypothetical protein
MRSRSERSVDDWPMFVVDEYLLQGNELVFRDLHRRGGSRQDRLTPAATIAMDSYGSRRGVMGTDRVSHASPSLGFQEIASPTGRIAWGMALTWP